MPTLARAWQHQACNGVHQICQIPALRLSRKQVRSQSMRQQAGHKLDDFRADVLDPDSQLDDILSCLSPPMQASPHPTRHHPASPPMTAGKQSVSKQPTAGHGHASMHARITALKARAVNLATKANSAPTSQGRQGVAAGAANITSGAHSNEVTGGHETQPVTQVPPLPVSPPPHTTCPAMSGRQESEVVGEHVMGISGHHHPQSHQQQQQQQFPKGSLPTRPSRPTRQHAGMEHAKGQGAHVANVSHSPQQDAVQQHVQGPPPIPMQPHPAPPPMTVSVPSTRRRRAERVAALQRPDHTDTSASPGREQNCEGRLGQDTGEATASASGTSPASTSATHMPTPCTDSSPKQQQQQLQSNGAPQQQRWQAVPVGNPTPEPTWAPQLAAWRGSPPVDLDNLASIDSTNWDVFAAAMFPMHHQPAYHATLFEFLVDLWPAVGIAETAGRGSTLARAAYSLLCGCWHSHEGAVRRWGVLAYAVALGDNDALQAGASAALAMEPGILAALSVLLPTLHPGEVGRGGLVAETYAAGTEAARKLQISQQQRPPQQPQQQERVGDWDGAGEWVAVAERLEALQHVHPSAPLGSLGCVINDYYPLPARGGGLRRA